MFLIYRVCLHTKVKWLTDGDYSTNASQTYVSVKRPILLKIPILVKDIYLNGTEWLVIVCLNQENI